MRARNLKPSIFKNEHLARLAPDSYRAFTGLWCLADREGRLEDRPARIEAEIFPFKFQKIDIEGLLQELASCEEPFISRYQSGDGKRFIQIVNFGKHQYPHIKEPKSTIPAPCKNGSKPISARLNPPSPILNPESPVADIAAVAAPTPQADFIDRFKKTYESKTGEPFKSDKKDFILAAGLISKHGLDPCVKKAMTLAVLCERKSAWFTSDGWASFNLGKLSSMWNSIIPEASQPTKEDEEREILKKQEALRVTADRLANGR